MNNFTRDLTMNVQDIQEVVHYALGPNARRGAPGGIPRAYQYVYDGCSARSRRADRQRQLSGAIRRVAITDHGNVQSFPHGFKAAKAGIQLIYGMEANIVETRCPSPITRWIWTSMKRLMWSLTWKRQDFQPFIMT